MKKFPTITDLQERQACVWESVSQQGSKTMLHALSKPVIGYGESYNSFVFLYLDGNKRIRGALYSVKNPNTRPEGSFEEIPYQDAYELIKEKKYFKGRVNEKEYETHKKFMKNAYKELGHLTLKRPDKTWDQFKSYSVLQFKNGKYFIERRYGKHKAKGWKSRLRADETNDTIKFMLEVIKKKDLVRKTPWGSKERWQVYENEISDDLLEKLQMQVMVKEL